MSDPFKDLMKRIERASLRPDLLQKVGEWPRVVEVEFSDPKEKPRYAIKYNNGEYYGQRWIKHSGYYHSGNQYDTKVYRCWKTLTGAIKFLRKLQSSTALNAGKSNTAGAARAKSATKTRSRGSRKAT